MDGRGSWAQNNIMEFENLHTDRSHSDLGVLTSPINWWGPK